MFAEFGGHEIDPALDVSTPAADCTNSAGDPDSAVQLLFTPSDAAVVTTPAQLVAAPGTPRPTTVAASALSLFEPAFTATLSDAGAGARLAGRPLSFLVSGAVRCTAVTNAQGVASCGSTLDGLAATLAGGYTARFGGTGGLGVRRQPRSQGSVILCLRSWTNRFAHERRQSVLSSGSIGRLPGHARAPARHRPPFGLGREGGRSSLVH